MPKLFFCSYYRFVRQGKMTNEYLIPKQPYGQM